MDIPTFTISARTHPNIADNIYDAQMDGAPKVLTYDGTNPLLRRAAMRYDWDGYVGTVPILKPRAGEKKTDRDEYPFACTLEGGSASRIAHVPYDENRSAGALMRVFFQQKGLEKGSVFRVAVHAHRDGWVTNPCRVKCAGCATRCH